MPKKLKIQQKYEEDQARQEANGNKQKDYLKSLLDSQIITQEEYNKRSSALDKQLAVEKERIEKDKEKKQKN